MAEAVVTLLIVERSCAKALQAVSGYLESIGAACTFSTGMSRSAIALLTPLVAATLCACAPLNQNRAERALAAGRLDDAVYDIQAALSHDPDNLQLKALAAQIFTQRGAAHYKQSEMLAADADFRTAISYNPGQAAAYDYLGLIAFQQHNWKDAIDFGDRAAGLEGKPDPDYVETARRELLKVQSGGFRPYLPRGRRPRIPPPPPS
jgi:tetratricopeptide (TPR) repeat protein